MSKGVQESQEQDRELNGKQPTPWEVRPLTDRRVSRRRRPGAVGHNSLVAAIDAAQLRLWSSAKRRFKRSRRARG